ncbi:MAG TPA: AtaL-like protein [Umezawaea sp.]|nr:AtaL-like protein [Umezawaea sp.]
MALTITHTVLLADPEEERYKGLSPEHIWPTMLEKAADPIDFVPMITESKIVERYSDGFLREVLFFGEDKVLERVRPRQDKYRIYFEVVDHPRLTLIYNELDRDLSGRFTYTLSTTFSDVYFDVVEDDPGALRKANDLLFDTASASAAHIAKIAGERALASASETLR